MQGLRECFFLVYPKLLLRHTTVAAMSIGMVDMNIGTTEITDIAITDQGMTGIGMRRRDVGAGVRRRDVGIITMTMTAGVASTSGCKKMFCVDRHNARVTG